MNQNIIEHQVFTYPFLFRIVFRYGNLIVTPIVILYSVALITFLKEEIIFTVPLVINLLIIYFLNKHFMKLKKILPYKIEVDEQKVICSDFFLSRKEIVFHYEDIKSLSGGIFENKLTGIMKVCAENKNLCFGFYQRLNKSAKLATILISKVNRPLYDQVLQRIVEGKQKIKR
ncbi:MAG: hypothetical protein DAHOPDDO_02385 [Ignavibacteriaceae bacterium]|nr:hypothetical protein [Ignavibacteriaceae bacterium]